MDDVRMYELANRSTIRLYYIHRCYMNPEYNTQIYRCNARIINYNNIHII